MVFGKRSSRLRGSQWAADSAALPLDVDMARGVRGWDQNLILLIQASCYRWERSLITPECWISKICYFPELGIKSLTNWKSYSQSQSKWPYNHDLKSLACTHDLKRIGIAKSVKISTLLSNHFPNQFSHARLRELHNWNFRIFKKRWQICFFSQVSKWRQRIWKWFDVNQIKSLITVLQNDVFGFFSWTTPNLRD